MTPPESAIKAAVNAARQSPCGKSKRGVSVFVIDAPVHWPVIGTGWNGMPGDGAVCTNDEACHRTCAMRCVHAETRALRMAARERSRIPWRHAETPIRHGRPLVDCDAVHVKINDSGELVPSGGPSCWQCSREVLDVGLSGFWLYEDPPTLECPPDCPVCKADCSLADVVASAASIGPRHPRWRRYTASEFHAATLLACGLS